MKIVNQYRIVTDNYCGYCAQVKFWWFPLMWFDVGGCNTSRTIERAMEFTKKKKVVAGPFFWEDA